VPGWAAWREQPSAQPGTPGSIGAPDVAESTVSNVSGLRVVWSVRSAGVTSASPGGTVRPMADILRFAPLRPELR